MRPKSVSSLLEDALYRIFGDGSDTLEMSVNIQKNGAGVPNVSARTLTANNELIAARIRQLSSGIRKLDGAAVHFCSAGELPDESEKVVVNLSSANEEWNKLALALKRNPKPE